MKLKTTPTIHTLLILLTFALTVSLVGCNNSEGSKTQGITLKERINQIDTAKPIQDKEISQIYQSILMGKANVESIYYEYQFDRNKAIREINGYIGSFNAIRIHFNAEQSTKFPEIAFYVHGPSY